MKKYAIFMVIIIVICWGIFFYQIRPEKPAVTIQFSNLYENMVNATVYISGHGSGVFIDDNVVLTAAHVLEGIATFKIEIPDGTILESSDFYIDEEEDVGFIFVDANELNIAKVSLLPVSLGDSVFLVGRPFGDKFKFSLTSGVVSYLGRYFPNMDWKDLIQTDAEGGPGSSGGPLFNSKGNLVGMYVGQVKGGGRGISLCENAKSILEAYQRCKDAQN